MGGENHLTIHELYAALTPSDSRSDWVSESAAATAGRYCRPLLLPLNRQRITVNI